MFPDVTWGSRRRFHLSYLFIRAAAQQVEFGELKLSGAVT